MRAGVGKAGGCQSLEWLSGATVPSEMEAADYGMLAVYVGGAVVMFWALALVTEEKFVPSLNAFATHAGIPPAVAG